MRRPAHSVVAAILLAGCASAPTGSGTVSGGPECIPAPFGWPLLGNNVEEIRQAMAREYQASGLVEQRVEGTTCVWMFVDTVGRVKHARIHAGSGHQALDRAALRVARVYRFTPRSRRGKPIEMRILLPITFLQARDPPDRPPFSPGLLRHPLPSPRPAAPKSPAAAATAGRRTAASSSIP